MCKIILEDRFTSHQKITFLIFIGAPFLIGIFSLSVLSNLNYKGFLMLFVLGMIYLFLISIAFLKRGFIKLNSKLYLGSFFLGKLLFKKEIDISNTPKIAILKFKKSQKFAWFSVAKPDLADAFDTFEINILNDKHTKRHPIIFLKNKGNVAPTIDFLTSNFDLKNEVYSPDFD
ncbi:hypothetical protein SCB49_14535 [unidentified eubacterium SCB49]|nr:hypothetical protein SCB49_14535 [unidentified eubacterium SCB49]